VVVVVVVGAGVGAGVTGTTTTSPIEGVVVVVVVRQHENTEQVPRQIVAPLLESISAGQETSAQVLRFVVVVVTVWQH